MGAILVTGPTLEAVTLAEAKQHLRIDSTDRDAQIAAQIIAATQWCEAYTRRAFMTQTWDFVWDWDWPVRGCSRWIDIPLAPVISITSVSYTATDGTVTALATDQYQVAGTGGEGIPRILEAYDVTWPEVRWQPEAVRVRAVCGYTTLPQVIRQAVLLQVELLHDRDGNAREMLEAARDALLDPYRVVRL